jgi:hypothetical protein
VVRIVHECECSNTVGLPGRSFRAGCYRQIVHGCLYLYADSSPRSPPHHSFSGDERAEAQPAIPARLRAHGSKPASDSEVRHRLASQSTPYGANTAASSIQMHLHACQLEVFIMREIMSQRRSLKAQTRVAVWASISFPVGSPS